MQWTFIPSSISNAFTLSDIGCGECGYGKCSCNWGCFTCKSTGLIHFIYPQCSDNKYKTLTLSAFIQLLQVRKITFTGSTAVGKKLMAGAAGTVKKVKI